MTVALTFEDRQGQTWNTAGVRHWTLAGHEAHETMGFHQGRANCAG
jgi:hypothetical protein